jgi:hypothetical protein
MSAIASDGSTASCIGVRGMRFAAMIGCMIGSAVKIVEAKTGVSRSLLAEPFLVSLCRALAPYRGCSHGCRYCDGRAEKYYVEGDFERDVAARTNLPERVAADVTAGKMAKEWGAVCIGSGVNDGPKLPNHFGQTRRAHGAGREQRCRPRRDRHRLAAAGRRPELRCVRAAEPGRRIDNTAGPVAL